MAEKTKKTVVRTLPHNVEAEQCLLGCVLVDGELSMEILAGLDEDDFYSPTHRVVCQAMKQVSRTGTPVDFVTVADELNRTGQMTAIGGIGYLTTLNSSVPSSANWKYYFDIVKKHAVMRGLISTCSAITESAYTAEDAQRTLAEAESRIYNLNTQSSTGDLKPIFDSVSEVFGKFETISKNPDALAGIPSGFKRLDKMTNGFHGGELIVIAGRPGMGKTSLAMNMVEHAALSKKYSCAVFSLEMSAESLLAKVCLLRRGRADVGGAGRQADAAAVAEPVERRRGFFESQNIRGRHVKHNGGADAVQMPPPQKQARSGHGAG